MMEEQDLSEEWLEDTWIELEKARGEMVLQGKKKSRPKKSGSLHEVILVFEDTDNLDLEETYSISIKADAIKTTINNGKTVKSVGIDKLKGNRLLEYIAGQDPESLIPQITMAFEKGYSLEISGSITIEEL